MTEHDPALGYAKTAEARLLSALLADHGAMADISAIITPRAFTDRVHRDIYTAMLHCWEQRIPTDFTNVDAQLAMDQARHAAITDLVALLNPDDPTWSPAYAVKYATRIRHAERFRRLTSAWQDGLTMMATNPDLDPAEVLMGVVGNVTQGDTATGGPLATADLVPALHAIIAEEQSGQRDTGGIPTGFTRLDDLMGGGIMPGELVILAARPSMGKTSLAVQMAMRAAVYGTSIVFSLEMDTDAILRRMIAIRSGVPHEAIRTSRYTDPQYTQVRQVMDELAGLPLVIDDTAGLTVDQIKVRIQRQQIQAPVTCVVVDYLEMVNHPEQNMEQKLSKIAQSLKQTAKECRVGIILLSQLSREVERRSPPVPKMPDLRYSGSLEAIADKILFVYREDYYIERGVLHESDRQEKAKNIAQIRLDKQRNGRIGIARLEWVGHCLAFRNPEYHEPIPEQAPL